MEQIGSHTNEAAERSGRRRFLRLAGAGLLGLSFAPLLAGCGPELPHIIEIHDDGGFTPGSLTVPRGATVRWRNMGVAPHSATDDPARAQKPAAAALPQDATPWDSGPLYAGQSWSYTFTVPGQYLYFSTFDPAGQMLGTITVTA